MILTFTDFGPGGPYTGQMLAVLRKLAPATPVIDLVHDAPRGNPRAAGRLLAALHADIPDAAVVVGVVDPGVGTARAAVLVEVEGRRYIGPDNGLFHAVAAAAGSGVRWQRIGWQPRKLSASFHGRDWFAPAAARLSAGIDLDLRPHTPVSVDWPAELPEVIYIDPYGNVMTGMAAAGVAESTVCEIGGQTIPHARTFAEAEPGQAFWYGNSIGLIELAVNGGRADTALGLAVGAPVSPPR